MSNLSEAQQIQADDLQAEGISGRRIAKELGVPYGAIRYYQEHKPRYPVVPAPAGGPKILIWDIETTPIKGWVWKAWDTNVIRVDQDWQLLSVAYKWYGSDEVGFLGTWQSSRSDDYDVAKLIHELMDEADILVAHNGDRFDTRKANARFLVHGFGPTSSFRSIDTLKVARKHFHNTYNSLKGIAELLKVEQKKQTSGFDLWLGCMNGDPVFTAEMEDYNRQDVISLESVYVKLIPWTTTINMGLYFDTREMLCSKCGSAHVERRGSRSTKVGVYQTFRCLDCMGYSSVRKREMNVSPVLT